MAERPSEEDQNRRSAFVHRVYRYLENNLPPEDRATLRVELMNDPVKQDLFVELCLTRQSVVQLFRGRAQYKRVSNAPAALEPKSFDPAETSLGDAMILPAISEVDTGQEDGPSQPEQWQPAPSYPLTSPAPPRWKTAAVRAAAILIPLAALPVVLHLTHSRAPNQTPAAVVETNVSPAPATASSIALRPPDGRLASASAAKLLQANLQATLQATLQVSLNATWDGQTATVNPGSMIPAGPHSLQSGDVLIRMGGGAMVVVEAPAQFEILASNRVRLTRGQMTANVPHDSDGLTVQTPNVNAIDLGTEFGLSVLPGRQTHLEVFQGQVRASVPSNATTVATTVATTAPATDQIVTTSHAVAIKSGSETIAKDAPAPLVFMRSQELTDRAAAGGNFGMARWRAFSETMRHDPDLVGYYTFDNQSENPTRLLNRSLLTQGQNDGELGVPGKASSSPAWDHGRWPEKTALLFGEKDANVVRIANDSHLIPDPPFSYCLWIKRWDIVKPVHLLSSAAGRVRCLDLTLIGRDGEKSPARIKNSVYFDMGPTPGKTAIAQSATEVLPTEFRWYLLSLTMDVDHIAHVYVDGRPAGQFLTQIPSLPRTSELWLGEPDLAAKDLGKTLTFRGWIDEFAIFKRVLSDGEIYRMYECGRPE
jgi:hypothetical protein